MNQEIRLLHGEKKLVDANPDHSIIWYRLFTIGIRYIILVGFIAFVIARLFPTDQRLFYQLLVALLVAIIFFGWASLDRIYRYYLFTNLRCISQSGIINKRRQIVAYDRIADIHLERNWLERVLNLSSIVLEDFSGNRPLKMIGLEVATAERIVSTVSSFMLEYRGMNKE